MKFPDFLVFQSYLAGNLITLYHESSLGCLIHIFHIIDNCVETIKSFVLNIVLTFLQINKKARLIFFLI